jgi:hypothetical protein
MSLGRVKTFCPSCGERITINEDEGLWHTKEWGWLCSRGCCDLLEIAHVRMMLGKDTDPVELGGKRTKDGEY